MPLHGLPGTPGSPFGAVVTAVISKFPLRGEPKADVKVSQSGNRRAQMYRPERGTPLFSAALGNLATLIHCLHGFPRECRSAKA